MHRSKPQKSQFKFVRPITQIVDYHLGRYCDYTPFAYNYTPNRLRLQPPKRQVGTPIRVAPDSALMALVARGPTVGVQPRPQRATIGKAYQRPDV